jgi:cytochrome o ubiquinol oxidase operon protein cyoD
MEVDAYEKVAQRHEERPGLISYCIGFFLSLLMTLVAYFIVVERSFDTPILLGVIYALAILQFWVQLRFFLHLGQEHQPRWKMLLFFFMLLVLFILAGGTLWIMYELQYNVMPNIKVTP